MEGLTVSTVKVGYGGTHCFYSKGRVWRDSPFLQLRESMEGLTVSTLKVEYGGTHRFYIKGRVWRDSPFLQ